MKKVLIVLGGIGLVLASCVIALGIVWYVITQPPAFSQNPPSYPNAQNLTTQEVNLPTNDPAVHVYKIVRFTTSDLSNSVLSFYSQQLGNAGWQYDTYAPARVNTIVYSRAGYGRSPPVYYVTVTTNPQPTIATEVEIRLSLHYGY